MRFWRPALEDLSEIGKLSEGASLEFERLCQSRIAAKILGAEGLVMEDNLKVLGQNSQKIKSKCP